MSLYFNIQADFDQQPSKFEEMTIGFLVHNLFELAHLPIDIISLKPGIFEACQFVLQEIIQHAESPILQAFNDGDFTPINSFFVHLDKLIDAYHPQQNDESANEKMKGLIRNIIGERSAIEGATGFSFHNNEILIARSAALGHPAALEWYTKEASIQPDDGDIPYHVIIGAYESEKCKWDSSSADKGVANLRKALFLIDALPDVANQPEYFGDYLNTILDEIVSLIKKGKIRPEQVKDCFDLVMAFYKKYPCGPGNGEAYYSEIFEMYSAPNLQEWLQKQIHALELAAKEKASSESNEDYFILNEAFELAVKWARLDKKAGEDKALRLLAEIMELAGIVRNQ